MKDVSAIIIPLMHSFGIGRLCKMKGVSTIIILFVYFWDRNTIRDEGCFSNNRTCYILLRTGRLHKMKHASATIISVIHYA